MGEFGVYPNAPHVSGKYKMLKENIAFILDSISNPDISLLEKENFLQKSTEIIRDILFQLNLYIKNHSVDTVLHELPETGQILGRLNISCTVRGCPALYKSLTSCIHGLWKTEPQTNLEKKASEWAMGQIRSTLCVDKLSYYSVCELGINPHRILSENTHQITVQLRNQLKKTISKGKKDLLTSTCQQHIKQTHVLVKSIIPHLLNAPINSSLLSLWEDILEALTLYPLNDQTSQQICQYLTQFLLRDTEFRPKLTVTTCHRLWTYSRASLEKEVLYRIEKCLPLSLPSSFEEVWNDSQLIEVCSRDSLLYTVVCQMLFTVLLPYNIEILGSFLRCVLMKTRITQDSEIMCHLYPDVFKQLVTLLAVHPEEVGLFQSKVRTACVIDFCVKSLGSMFVTKILQNVVTDGLTDKLTKRDIEPENVGPTIQRICELFKGIEIEDADSTELLVLSLQFKQWYQKSVHHCFICDRQVLPWCLELISFYCSVWYKTTTQHVKNILTRIVLCLRPLLVKSTLCYTDVMCVLTGNQVSSQGQMKDTVYHILLMFLYQASGGLNILRQILPLVTGSENDVDHMTCLMESHDNLLINFSEWTVYKTRQYKEILLNLLKNSENNLSSDVSHVAKCFVDKH